MADSLGTRIQRYRRERDLSINELAQRSGVAKSYLSTLEDESDETPRRPSAETLYRIAEVLGVAVSDLFGRSLEYSVPSEIPSSLKKFAEEEGIPKADVDMLASIQFRGDRPETPERWGFIYQAIKHSRSMDQR